MFVKWQKDRNEQNGNFMDLTKEIKAIIENGNANETIRNLRKQQEELSKKIFITQVIEIVSFAEKLVEENEFQKNDIQQFHLSWHIADDGENIFDFKFSDNKGNRFVTSNKDLSKLAGCFILLSDFNCKFINEKFKEGEKFILATDNTLKEQLLDLLLSTELRRIVDYNELQLEMKDGFKEAVKRNKI